VERSGATTADLRDSATAAAMSSRCAVALTDSAIQFRRTAFLEKGPEPMLKIARPEAALTRRGTGECQWI
jgi:hypothetical protein